ncbi:hypothetical protein NXY11_04720 [Parabacteroides faecis]|uniref:hypothetical protein n=1 Tax=Parabacteroides faecis TaxID=1217282 RepID=UPI002164D018|nr:hypothetical protein [Parabacteroides faecis]MCS2893864.1 hypothetical protein [Parabacteroides faecis]UVQ47552.1 hypothetical protein NXY11_04720 [Parabacteroides faecis]
MRTNIYSLFMLAFIAAFTVSCSQSNDLLEQTEQNIETRAGSPLLIATPTEVNYTDVEATLTNIVEQTVNIKTAGLSPLAALTAFNVTVQGADRSKFLVDYPRLNLAGLLKALLGGGVDITVSYYPKTDIGEHNAELLVTASLLGLVMPIQTTIPLHGTSIAPNAPKVIKTIPVNGGSVTFDSRVPDTEGTVPVGQYHLDFIFDQDIIISNNFSLNWPVSAPVAIFISSEIVDNRTLRVHLQDDALTGPLTHPIQIGAGSVINKQFVECGNIYLIYTVTGDVP